MKSGRPIKIKINKKKITVLINTGLSEQGIQDKMKFTFCAEQSSQLHSLIA